MDFPTSFSTYSSREANQRFSELKRRAKERPVIVENRGTPETVILSYSHFEMLHGALMRSESPRTLLDVAMSPAAQATAGIDFEPRRRDVQLREVDLD